MEVEAEADKNAGAGAIVARTIIGTGAVIRVRRRPRIIAGRGIIINDGRRWSWRRHPVAVGAVLNLSELIGASRHRRGKEEGHGGKKAEDKFLHRWNMTLIES
jgi:hypothetical protein